MTSLGPRLLSPRTTLRIATWNVRTLYQTGRVQQVAAEMKRLKIELMGLCETRWPGTGMTRLQGGETIIYSGIAEEQRDSHTRGVGILMSKDTARALIEWEPVSERIIKARFKSRCQNTTVIQVYAPTNEASKEDKDTFYQKLHSIMMNRKKRDVTFVMGDLNAQVGSSNEEHKNVMGCHGVGTMNDNGERLADFCATEDLVIGGTLFPHKTAHKVTWRAPGGAYENQIDHLMISRRWRTTVQDCRVKRSADAGSDHHLLVADCRLKLAAQRTKKTPAVKYNTEKLKHPQKKEEFRIALANRFDALNYGSDEETDDEGEDEIEKEWNVMKKAYTEACKEVLGKRRKDQKIWMSEETWELVEQRRMKKAKIDEARTRGQKATAMSDYNEANKQVKKSCKKDKRVWAEGIADEAEEAAARQDTKALYELTRILSGKGTQQCKPVRDKAGEILKTTEEQMTRWKEHFEEVLNRPAPLNPPNLVQSEETLDIEIGRISKDEIRKALKALKKGKAAGCDNIPPEAWREGGEMSVNALHKLLNTIWNEERVPQDWKRGHIVKLPKKGDLTRCSNWRGIMLLPIASKILTRVMLNRTADAMDKKLRDNQAGFRKHRSCCDQIATLRIIVEQSMEYNSQLYLVFVDYEKAFDSVDRETLWKILLHYGVPPKMVNMIKVFYQDFQAQVIHGGSLTEPFVMKTGVRQGCLLSPMLFIVALDWIMRETTESKKTGIQWTLTERLEDLDFADDLVLLSQNIAHMREKVERLEDVSSKVGLKINAKKTQEMRIRTKGRANPIICRDQQIEKVDEFVYLGSKINPEEGSHPDIQARINKAHTAFNMLRPVWRSRGLTNKTKIRLFNSNVLSVLLYGCETWGLTKEALRRLEVFLNKRLRFILRLWWPIHVTTEELLRMANQEPLENVIRRRRWRWLGHTLRKDPNRITRQSIEWNPQGKRHRGRPKMTWRRGLNKDLNAANKTWGEVKVLAGDRNVWRRTVESLCSREGEED